MADDPSERLCRHRMLPVLIEEEFSKKLPEGKRFFEAIRRQLQDLIGESESIPAELLERLLRERRILVIVDHFSEMSNDTREEIQPAHPESHSTRWCSPRVTMKSLVSRRRLSLIAS